MRFELLTKLIAAAALTVAMMTGTPVRAGIIEDFEAGPPGLANYTDTGSAGASITAGAAHDGNFGLNIANAGPGGWIYRTDAPVQVGQGHTLSAWAQVGPDGRAYFGFGASANGALSVVMGSNTGTFIIQDNAGYGFSEIAAVTQSFQASHWYRIDVVWGVGGSIIANLFDSDGTTLLNTVSATDNSVTSGGIAFRGIEFGQPNNLVNFDTICVDNCVATPEPTALVLLTTGLIGLAGARRRKAA